MRHTDRIKAMKILIAALNSKNIHKSPAPWYLKAYFEKQIPGYTVDVYENSVNDNINSIIADIYGYAPDVVGFSCYIWNIEYFVKIGAVIKKLLPSVVIVLGGPEVSFCDIKDYPFADYLIKGAGEKAFYALLKDLSEGRKTDAENIMPFAGLPSPFTADYFDSFKKSGMGIANQLVYYESSRGCPFCCSYCLSCALDGVEYLPLSRVFDELRLLLKNGARCIKFVDRTFNSHRERAFEILNFIYNLETGCVFHFEVSADLFDERLLQLIEKMPVTRVQFEIGIQTTNKKTLECVSRKTDLDLAFCNIERLVKMKNCHIHVDLIAGLPFDNFDTFSDSIDRCFSVYPHMLQLGFLKMLKGSKIREQAGFFGYEYADFPPYEAVKSNALTFEEIALLKGIEAVIDKFYNSGLFYNTVRFAMEELFDGGTAFFGALALFCKKNGGIKVTLKNAYTLIMNFLLQYAHMEQVCHYIKLDCLSYDTKGLLPDAIAANRDKAAEAKIKKEKGYKKVRVEFFEYDSVTRVFVYDIKNPVDMSYLITQI